MKNRNYKYISGFTMIEVLIALVILAIGLLGVAGLQVTGMRNNNSANLRSQATILAYEFGDILRSNKVAVDNNDFDGPFDTSNLNLGRTDSCYTTTGCSTTQMANTSIVDWGADVSVRLPNGVATTARSGNVFSVTLTWDDDRNSTSPSFSFTTDLQP